MNNRKKQLVIVVAFKRSCIGKITGRGRIIGLVVRYIYEGGINHLREIGTFYKFPQYDGISFSGGKANGVHR